jgi:hypothetical protein
MDRNSKKRKEICAQNVAFVRNFVYILRKELRGIFFKLLQVYKKGIDNEIKIHYYSHCNNDWVHIVVGREVKQDDS